MARPERKSNATTKMFADRLSDLVEEKKKTGLSQKEIAAQIGVSSGTLSEWCSDNKTPMIDALPKVANYFNVSIDWLLGESEAKTRNTTTQAIHHETGLSDTAIDILRNLSDNEKRFLNRLLEDRGNFYFIADAFANFKRKSGLNQAIDDGIIEADFGPDTLCIKKDLDFARFTLVNQFMLFVDKDN